MTPLDDQGLRREQLQAMTSQQIVLRIAEDAQRGKNLLIDHLAKPMQAAANAFKAFGQMLVEYQKAQHENRFRRHRKRRRRPGPEELN